MKKSLHSIIRKAAAALLLTAAGTLPMLADGTIPYRANFNNEQMRYSSKGEYSKITSTDIATYGEVGAPALPVRTYRFVVPVYTGRFSVSMTLPEKASETVTLDTPVMPVQRPMRAGDLQEEKFTIDTKAYNKVYSPKAWVVDDYFIDGSNHIVTVAVMPVEYNPVASTMKYYPYADIKLNYADVAVTEMSSRPVFTKRPDPNLDLSKIAVNGESPKRITYPEFDGQDWSKGTYFIISPSAYISAFKELAEWKRSKGYYVIVQSIDSILANPAYANGDVISNINDDAGKLRMCLRDTFATYGRSYVLLAGDYHTNFPVRLSHYIDSKDGEVIVTPSSTDVYFSDMTGNWDANRNGMYGEQPDYVWKKLKDSVNFYPDMIVGRLLCKNAREVENYTRKLMLYERNPGLGDYSYLSKGFVSYPNEYPFITSDGENRYVQLIRDDFNSKFETVKEMLSRPGVYNKASGVLAEMNNGYGFNIIAGHGQPHNITISKTNVGILNLLWAIDSYNNKTTIDTNVGFDNLSNITKPSILFASACTTIPFDQYNNGPNGYYQEYTLGAAYTVGGLYGGVSYIGFTEEGYEPEDSYVTKELFNQIDNGQSIGNIVSTAKYNRYCVNSKMACGYLCALRGSLIGDPEMNVWTKAPKSFYITPSLTNEGTANFESLWTQNATVIVSDGKKTTLQTTVPNNPLDFSISNVNKKCVTFTKPGYLPQSFLFIDNSYINDERTYFMTSGTIKGLEIGYGGKVTIYASGNITLDAGCKILARGCLEIITDGSILLKNGTLDSGGMVSLKARGPISIYSSFAVKGGSILRQSYIQLTSH